MSKNSKAILLKADTTLFRYSDLSAVFPVQRFKRGGVEIEVAMFTKSIGGGLHKPVGPFIRKVKVPPAPGDVPASFAALRELTHLVEVAIMRDDIWPEAAGRTDGERA